METVLDKIRNQAKALNRKVCLTESDDPRNLKAAEKLVKLGYARPVLVGCVEEIKKLAQENNVCLDGVELVDVLKTPELDRYIATVVEIRKNKGLTPEQAREWLKDTCPRLCLLRRQSDRLRTQHRPENQTRASAFQSRSGQQDRLQLLRHADARSQMGL